VFAEEHGIEPNTKNNMALKIPNFFRRLAEIEVEQTLDFLASNRNQHDAEAAVLSKSAATDSDLAEFAGDTKAHLDELLLLAEQSAVQALYRVVELNSVKIAEWRWGAETVKTKQLFRADRLESELSLQLQLDVKKLPGFSAVDELRLLNNAIKHEGVVSDKLAKYAGWTAGSPFANLDSFVRRVAPDVPKYLEALAASIIPSQGKPSGV